MSNKIKLLLPLVLCLMLTGMQACKKYNGDSYDFSQMEKHYMNFSTKSVAFNADTAYDAVSKKFLYVKAPNKVTLTTRVGFVEPLQVVLTLAVKNGKTETVNVSYDKFTTSKAVNFTLDESYFAPGVNEISGTITLTSAKGANYGDLRLGYPAVGDATVVNFVAFKPGSEYVEE